MFTLRDAPYKRADAVENLAVKGLNSEVTQLLEMTLMGWQPS